MLRKLMVLLLVVLLPVGALAATPDEEMDAFCIAEGIALLEKSAGLAADGVVSALYSMDTVLEEIAADIGSYDYTAPIAAYAVPIDIDSLIAEMDWEDSFSTYPQSVQDHMRAAVPGAMANYMQSSLSATKVAVMSILRASRGYYWPDNQPASPVMVLLQYVDAPYTGIITYAMGENDILYINAAFMEDTDMVARYMETETETPGRKRYGIQQQKNAIGVRTYGAQALSVMLAPAD